MVTEEHKPLLEVFGLSKQFFGTKVLDNVGFTLEKGCVLGVAGENGAGKSTLAKCLYGLYRTDSGKILIDGTNCTNHDVFAMQKAGIALVEQEPAIATDVTVSENIYAGRIPRKYRFINKTEMFRQTEKLFDFLGIHDIAPEDKAGKYSIASLQMCSIARAVSYNPKVIIMDEPTSSLTLEKTRLLYKIIDILKSKGTSIIYISHKIEELIRLSDYVTVLRNGTQVLMKNTKLTGKEEIIKSMVGYRLENLYPNRKTSVLKKNNSEPMLKVTDFTALDKSFSHISFELKKGEILGMAGLVGSGRTEFAQSLFGLRKAFGKLEIKGKTVIVENPRQAMKNGMVMLTEDRLDTGIVPELSVSGNIIAANLKKYINKYGLIDNDKTAKDISDSFDKLNIKAFSHDEQIKYLSGGNQQKALISRWLLLEPDIFIMDEPTRGVDVGCKKEIYKLISEFASSGKSVILISSDLPEVVGMCDRILIMRNKKQVGIYDSDKVTYESVLTLMLGAENEEQDR